jgi:hypothetical protein
VVKIGAKVVAHARYLVFQMAEVPCRGSLDLRAYLRGKGVLR